MMENGGERAASWLKFILKDRSTVQGVSLGLLISAGALLIIELLMRVSGIYFTPICVVFSMVAALVCGFLPGVLITILLTFSTDYLYVPPIGSILDTKEGVEHFFIIMLSCITVSGLTSLLKTTIRRLDRAKANVLELNRELAERGDHATEASRLKTLFLTNMSHEIRTPINGVLGMTDLLQRTRLDPQQKRYTDAISNSSNLLLSLVNTILDISKIEAGRLELEILPFDLRKVMDETRSAFEPLAELRGLQTRWSIDLPSDHFFAGDASRLRQILNNLIGNAIKFTPQGSVAIDVKMQPQNAPSQLRSIVEFTITDTGIGISPAHLSKMFQVFSQADASTSRRFGGSGLGLAISKQLVQLMEGEIEVQSTEGQGTVFRLTLPFAKVSRESLRPTTAPPAPFMATPDERRHACVLLAEDNEINEEITTVILKNAGYRVDTVRSGDDVLASVEKHRYLCIVMDCQMPGMDGYEATRILREHGYDIPIIALTANAFQTDKERCLAVGMNEYLAKPAFSEQLLPILDRFLQAESGVLDSTVLARLNSLDPSGDGTLLRTLLNVHLHRTPEALRTIRRAIENADAESLRKTAHLLRSSSATLGAVRASQILFEIEDRVEREGRADVDAKTIDVLQRELALAQRALENYIDDHSSRTP